jgi:hypothetical protein
MWRFRFTPFFFGGGDDNIFLLCKTTLLSVSLLPIILHFTLLSDYVPNAIWVNSKYQQRAVSHLRPTVIFLNLLTEVLIGGRHAAPWYRATEFWVRWVLYVSVRRISARILVHSVYGMQYTSYQSRFYFGEFDSNFNTCEVSVPSLAWSVYRFSRLKISCFFLSTSIHIIRIVP